MGWLEPSTGMGLRKGHPTHHKQKNCKPSLLRIFPANLFFENQFFREIVYMGGAESSAPVWEHCGILSVRRWASKVEKGSEPKIQFRCHDLF